MHTSPNHVPSLREMNRTIFAWPPHPTVLTFYILARTTLIVNSIIGMGICFASDFPAAIVAGSFHAISTAILPGLLFWSIRHFRAALRHEMTMKSAGHAVLDNPRQPGLKILKMATFLDALGILGFTIAYPLFMDGAHNYSWEYVKEDYASVTVLIPL